MKRFSLTVAALSVGLLAGCNYASIPDKSLTPPSTGSGGSTGSQPISSPVTPTPSRPLPFPPLPAPQPPKPLIDAYKTQQLNWESCPDNFLDDTFGPGGQAHIKKLGERLQCAVMQVPIDWNNLSLGTMGIELSRLKAVPEKRQGSLFFNPGGPGESGLELPVYLDDAWSSANPKTEVGKQFNRLSAEYDLIGFAPRGTGQKKNLNQLRCTSEEIVSGFYNASGDRSDENINKMITYGKVIADACAQNPLTPYVNTEANVRDMDLIRHLLGDEKINFLGYSYGTWLGDWYARLFPEHTGRMVLDSNMDISADSIEPSFKGQAHAFERSLRYAALPYFARHDDLWGLGTDSEELYQRLVAMSEPLRSTYSLQIARPIYAGFVFPDAALWTRVALELDQLIKKDPRANMQQLQERLQPILKKDKRIKADSLEEMLFMAKMLLSRKDLLSSPPRPLGTVDGTYHAVNCNDGPWTTDINHWRAFDDEQAKLYPLFGGQKIISPCLHWSLPHVKKPAAHNIPFLMVQSEYDAATNTEGALNAFNNLPNAKMIFVPNEPSHGLFSRYNNCIDKIVLSYLLDNVLPKERKVECQANPLPHENGKIYPITPAHSVYHESTEALEESGEEVFPPEAKVALEKAHRLIEKAAQQR